MATTEDIVKDLSAIAPITVPQVVAAKWVDNRYRELISKVQFKHLRKVGELIIPATVSTGTLAVTRGSSTVTGAGTTFTNIGTGTQEHYYLRASNAWYKIASIDSDTSITLDAEYAEDTNTAASYDIVKRTHSLASDCRWITSVVFPRLRFAMRKMSEVEMDITFPGRTLSGSYPMHYAQAGHDSNGNIKIEVYPVPQVSELIRYVYYSIPTQLTFSTTIPSNIDPHILKEGALIDLYRYLKIEATSNGNVDAAGLYANEEAKQRTVWRQHIKDCLRTQSAIDDLSFVLRDFSGHRAKSDIVTARDYVHTQWPQ